MTMQDAVAFVLLLALIAVTLYARQRIHKEERLSRSVDYSGFFQGNNTESMTAVRLACEASLRRSRHRRGLPLEGSGETDRG